MGGMDISIIQFIDKFAGKIMKLWNKFFKSKADVSAAEPTVEAIAVQPKTDSPKKPRKPRAPRKKKEEPVVNVVDFKFNHKNPREGTIVLDWNAEFVEVLKSHGYTGAEPEDIVNTWLSDVCNTIANSDEFANPSSSPSPLGRRQR